MTHPSHSGNTSEWELMRRHFSDERLRLYLTEANGDEDAAAHLYQWNSRCSAAFWELPSRSSASSASVFCKAGRRSWIHGSRWAGPRSERWWG